MSSPAVCTIATGPQVAHVRVLARSLRDHEPGSRLQVLFVEDPFGDDRRIEASDFDRVRARDIGISDEEFHVAAAHLSETELSLWLRPKLMLALLESGDDRPVIFLSPDSVVFGPLGPVGELLDGHAVVRVPLATASDSALSARRHAEYPGELRAWVPGLVATNRRARDWLSAVHARARLGAHPQVIVGDALRADWDALGIGEVDLGIMQRAGVGVGHWHLAARKLELRGERFFVDDDPLVVFHFEGFDPNRPWALAPDTGGADGSLLAEDVATRSLCRRYAEALFDSGFESAATFEHRWATLPDGFAMNRRIRQAVRDAVIGDAEGMEYEPPPDPFNPQTLPAFYRWLASPEPQNDRAPGTARLYYGIYRAREDLRAEFPELSLADAPAFRQWAHRRAHHEYRIPPAVSEEAFENLAWPQVTLPQWAPPDALHEGFLVTGYLRAELGIGDAARRLLIALRRARIKCSGFSFSLTKNRQHDVSVMDEDVATDLDTNVVCVNSDQFVYFSRFVGPEFFDGRYTVGSWAWETENPPAQMGGVARFFDEIWVPSAFCADAIRTITDVPVLVFGYPVEVPHVDVAVDTRRLGMPDGFVFFFMFDFLSTISRKNPVGLIEAFSRAFRPGEGPSLVLKSINADERAVDAAGIKDAIGDRKDIILIDAYYSSDECAAMLARADCYVSLHRAEGFGLTLAESMALGVPVIATGYSGNLDFMDDDSAFLVPAGRSRVGRGSPPYPPDSIWGEPDLDVAAEHMRRVYEFPKEASKRAATARKRVLREHGYKAAERFLRGRTKEIQRTRRAGFSGTTARLLHDRQAVPDWVGLVHQMIDYPDP
jgi:glycosyltransferase involved in cell wall biosynthesis